MARKGDFKVEVEGARELRREIRRMEGKELRRELRKAGRDAGEPALKDAQQFISRHHTRSGRLGRSLGLQVSDSSTRLKIGTNSMEYHGPFIGGWRARGLPPRPVLGVAAAKTRKERQAAYEAAMDRLTKKVRRRRR